MKIGILTLPLHSNYGGILQAWALQTVLHRFGHEVEIFMPLQMKKKNRYFILYFKRLILKILGKLNIPIFYERKLEKNRKFIDRFIKKNLNIKYINSFEDIENELDVIIVGSDQVWRKEYFENLWRKPIENAFLSFSKDCNIKRIAYSVSFGVDDWQFDKKETDLIQKYLAIFDNISIRENSGCILLKRHTGIESFNSLDPTLLLTSSDYLRLISKEVNKIGHNQDYIACYILDNTNKVNEIINHIAQKKNLNTVYLKKNIEREKLLSIEKWISTVANAKMVITDSFHGCLFSIIFNKPLIFTENKERGNARFQSIIDTFNLENNMLESKENFNNNSDYLLPLNIHEKIEDLKNYSFNILKSSLG